MKQREWKLIVIMMGVVCLVAGTVMAAESSDGKTRPEATAAPQPGAATTSSLSDAFHNPAPWLEMGLEFRFREHYGYNWTGLNDDEMYKSTWSNNDFHFERYRTRWWTKIKADEKTAINTRFTWEFRTYDEPPSKDQHTDFDEIIMDNFNLAMRNFLGMPATAIIGRQDMVLGQGWLVADGTPLDGSRTFYFDAARFTFDASEKTKLDLIYINQHPNSDWWLKPINDRNKYVTQEQEQGGILYLTDKSFGSTQLEGYFMYKNNNPLDGPAFNFPSAGISKFSKKAEIYTFGGAASAPIWGNWNYRIEGAVQTGDSASPSTLLTANDETETLRAFGGKGNLEYSFKDTLDNKVHVIYEYLSGDDPHTSRVESFNPLWAQWPQWSELYQPYVTQLEDNLVSNMHRVALGHKMKPNAQWEILTDYHLLWAAENTFEGNAKFTDNGSFRGQLITCWARYNFTKQLKGNLVGEYFMPGDYYAKANRDDALYFHFTLEYTF